MWVGFLDDDDVWLSNKLEIFYIKISNSQDNVGFIYSGYSTYNFTKKQEIFQHMPVKKKLKFKDILYKNYIGTFSVVAIHADLLKKIGGLDERFGSMQDMELYVRILNITQIVSVNKKLSYIRVSNLDRISLKTEIKLYTSLLFWEKYHQFINQNLKLRCRAASRVFIYSHRLKKWGYFFKTLYWILIGLIVDVHNSIWTFRKILSVYINRR